MSDEEEAAVTVQKGDVVVTRHPSCDMGICSKANMGKASQPGNPVFRNCTKQPSVRFGDSKYILHSPCGVPFHSYDPSRGANKIQKGINRSPFQRVVYLSDLSSTLKPAGGAHHRHGLIHDPLADTEVVVKPLLDFFIIRELFGLHTGAKDGPRTHATRRRVARGSTELAGRSFMFGRGCSYRMGMSHIRSKQNKQEGRGSYLREACGALDASKESRDYREIDMLAQSHFEIWCQAKLRSLTEDRIKCVVGKTAELLESIGQSHHIYRLEKLMKLRVGQEED